MTGNNKNIFLKVFNKNFQSFLGKKIIFVKETKDFYFNPLNKKNGDQMNALLLILHLIPISTPRSIDRKCALEHCSKIGGPTLQSINLTNLAWGQCVNISPRIGRWWGTGGILKCEYRAQYWWLLCIFMKTFMSLFS